MLPIIAYAEPQIQTADVFDATTSLVDLGVRPEQWPFAQTVCAYVNPAGAGESGTNTVFSVNSAANVNDGTRFRFGDAAGFQIYFNANSAGTAGAPVRNGTDVLSYNVWHFVAATWDGTLTATGIRLFYARADNKNLIECTYGTTSNGTTAVAPGVGKPMAIGNRPDGGRTFNGSIGALARWSRVLSFNELAAVYAQGLLSMNDGTQILCRANRRDYSRYGVKDLARINVAYGAAPPPFMRLGSTAQRAFYYPSVVSTGEIKTGNGLAIASIKTFNGLAKASVKTANGLRP